MAAPIKDGIDRIASSVFNIDRFSYNDQGSISGFFGKGADKSDTPFLFDGPLELKDLAMTLQMASMSMHGVVKKDIHAQLADKEWHVAPKIAGIAEAVIVADEVFYCRMIEDCLPKGGLYTALNDMNEMLKKLIEHAKTELNPCQRQIHSARINIAVVWKRAIARLIRMHCTNKDELSWKSYSRFYFDGSEILVKVGELSLPHMYEYQGTVELLTVTQLTEQLNLAYSEALKAKKAHASLGPAGSGKTETVKDFGKKLGRWVIVIESNDELTRANFSDIVKAMTGGRTWCVFDEFNRVSTEVST